MTTSAIPTTVTLRAPSSHTVTGAANTPSSISPPRASFLAGTWHVTHSTLPMWKNKYGVTITYTPLPSSDPSSSSSPDLDDLVSYHKTAGGAGKPSTVHGLSRSTLLPTLGSGWAYSWRGKGWLTIASSSWEILGYGEDLAASAPGCGDSQGREWVVTYFSKTLFTPAGVDVYSRHEGGVSGECLAGIKRALGKVEGLESLAGELFEVPRE